MSSVIQVENLSKYYRLGVIDSQTLREDVARWWAKIRGESDPLAPVNKTVQKNAGLWALQGVNFDIQEGEIVGIVGSNGSGKSTLLKILSRITAPTTGRVVLHGRVGSLLEVGTGFHPELTGRENVYLNGAILGMTRAEVTAKLDEIVAFADMGKFIDTPVKRYSSGMTVRLAFAVAAHLDPEILIVDEVLAVGDAEFQQKCVGKMRGVAEQGRTVLFVSHNMSTVARLCQRGILIKQGQVQLDAPIQPVLNAYEQALKDVQTASNQLYPISIEKISILDEHQKPVSQVLPGSTCYVELLCHSHSNSSQLNVSLGIYNELSQRLSLVDSNAIQQQFDVKQGEQFIVRCKITRLPLTLGRYALNVAFNNGKHLLHGIERAGVIVVGNTDFVLSESPEFGPVYIQQEWQFETLKKP